MLWLKWCCWIRQVFAPLQTFWQWTLKRLASTSHPARRCFADGVSDCFRLRSTYFYVLQCNESNNSGNANLLSQLLHCLVIALPLKKSACFSEHETGLCPHENETQKKIFFSLEGFAVAQLKVCSFTVNLVELKKSLFLLKTAHLTLITSYNHQPEGCETVHSVVQQLYKWINADTLLTRRRARTGQQSYNDKEGADAQWRNN